MRLQHASVDSPSRRARSATLVALPLAVAVGVGCAYGTSADPGGSGDPDASACAALGCGSVDAGASYGDSPASFYPDGGADDAAQHDAGHVGSDGGTSGTDSAVPEDHFVAPDAIVTCTLSLPTGLPACDACLQSSCCAADDACGSDPACLSFDSCLAGCEGYFPDGGGGGREGGVADAGVAACVNACQLAYPTGASELAALESCLSTSCASACTGP